jgi:hypothetical protein
MSSYNQVAHGKLIVILTLHGILVFFERWVFEIFIKNKLPFCILVLKQIDGKSRSLKKINPKINHLLLFDVQCCRKKIKKLELVLLQTKFIVWPII